jgi:hypothetical protein
MLPMMKRMNATMQTIRRSYRTPRMNEGNNSDDSTGTGNKSVRASRSNVIIKRNTSPVRLIHCMYLGTFNFCMGLSKVTNRKPAQAASYLT